MESGAAPRTPTGLRIYAIGDIHGRADLLETVQGRIAGDLAHRPPADWRVVYLGDYVDRGPDSAGVIDRLAVTGPADRSYFLRGNHDHALAAFLADPDTPGLYRWLDDGGCKTLRSYGIEVYTPTEIPDARARRALRSALVAAMPAEHVGFLEGLPHLIRLGDYAFVHAGVRPGVALEAQTPRDLMEIREPFLASTADFGAVVVHGHSPAPRPERRANRIGIDTGAGQGGPLTCLVLEGAEVAVLGPKGPRALPLPENVAAEERAA